jgi:tetratricopeptide (TPR) repeat protein
MVLAPFFFMLNLDVKADKAWFYHHKRSDYYFHQGNYPEMLYHAKEMVKIDSKDVETWSSIGYYYWSMGIDNKNRAQEFNAKALKYYTDGIKANTDTYYLYDEVGKFYFNSKDYSSAIEYFEIAITKKDCKNIPYHILAICYEAKNDPVKALSTIKKCLDKFPNDAKAKVELNKLISKIKD